MTLKGFEVIEISVPTFDLSENTKNIFLLAAFTATECKKSLCQSSYWMSNESNQNKYFYNFYVTKN